MTNDKTTTTERVKLSESQVPKHLREEGHMKIDAQYHYVNYYQTWNGATCVNAGIQSMSLRNKTDRRRIRRVAEELIAACDLSEITDRVSKR